MDRLPPRDGGRVAARAMRAALLLVLAVLAEVLTLAPWQVTSGS
jgi:cytochrome oxidase assembly protein ShyY1